MERKKNKNCRNVPHGRRRLLKVNSKTVSWLSILLNIALLANTFKDCLILLQNKEIYVFTLTSVRLFAVLQETSFRKGILLRDLHSYCSNYGTNHTLAIVWTEDGDARVIPDCFDTKHLFNEISNEIRDATNAPAMVSVSYRSLINTTFEKKTETYAVVNFVNGICFEKNAFERQPQKCKKSSGNTFSLANSKKVEPARSKYSTVIEPYTENKYATEAGYPQQVSSEQGNEGQSVIAFSNGASLLPLENHVYSFGPFSNRTSSGVSSNTATTPAVPGRSPGLAKYPAYVDYSERLRTYARWTHRKPDPTQLSESGFFFTNNGDLVRCYQCGIGLKDFTADDDPLLEHVRHSSQCPFLSEHLGSSRISSILNELKRHDPELNRRRQLEQRPGTRPELNYECRHPEYKSFASRLSSFAKWPTQMIQTPAQLAEAGLFYTGFEDQVRCFCCDGGLRRWDPDDDPWTEHCRWFPACPFARRQKGDEYIALVQSSVDYGKEESGRNSSSRQYDEGMSNAIEQMTLRDPEFRAAVDEHRETCLEMGYQLEDFNEAVQELRKSGKIKPTIEELLDTIEMIKEKRKQAIEQEKKHNETPVEENQRLKSFVICMFCDKNDVNALFLPCSHHRLCMACAEPLSQCPVCDRNIRQKIRTYMA